VSEEFISHDEYDAFRQFLEDASGIVLGDSKQYLVGSRLNRLMVQQKLKNFTELMQCLQTNRVNGLRERVIEAMTTNETMWFRDNYPFDALKEHVFPSFAKLKERPLRIWSSACSTGQEPYSISMAFEEYQLSNPGALSGGLDIIATDLSTEAIKIAQLGHYDASSMSRGIDDARRDRYFKQHETVWEIMPRIKERVTFRQLNLKDTYSLLGKFDVVFCRNVLIYFSMDLKSDILRRMSDTLNPNGFLLLGSSEVPNRYVSNFKMIRVTQGMLYQREN